MSIVTLSIKDIPYPLVADTAFHPINTEVAIQRIRGNFYNKVADRIEHHHVVTDMVLTTVLASSKAQSVWATVFEYNNQPFFIVRNLAYTNTTLVYRRVLVVKMDTFSTPYSMRTWDPVCNSLRNEGFYPSLSETTVQ